MAHLNVEFVCGPPGSGKSSYCEGRRQYMADLLDRNVFIVNLDPANDLIEIQGDTHSRQYQCSININDYISHQKVMDTELLEPNGAYIFCADAIAHNVNHWVIDNIKNIISKYNISDQPIWCIIDCPGQVEFYLQSEAMKNIILALQHQIANISLCMVHLCDAVISTRSLSSYMSTCLLSISTMTDLELPHLNILTKWDLVESNGINTIQGNETYKYLDTSTFYENHFKLLFNKEYQITDSTQTNLIELYRNKHDFFESLFSVIDGYNLVTFLPLDIYSSDKMKVITDQIDVIFGYFS